MLQVTKTTRNQYVYIGIIVNGSIVILYIYSYDNVYSSITIEVYLHTKKLTRL